MKHAQEQAHGGEAAANGSLLRTPGNPNKPTERKTEAEECREEAAKRAALRNRQGGGMSHVGAIVAELLDGAPAPDAPRAETGSKIVPFPGSRRRSPKGAGAPMSESEQDERRRLLMEQARRLQASEERSDGNGK